MLFLLATPFCPYWTLEGLFELTWRPSRALYLPCALLLELQRNKNDAVRCSTLGRDWRSYDTVKNNWRKPPFCVCWKCTFLHWSMIVKSQQNRIESVTRPVGKTAGWTSTSGTTSQTYWGSRQPCSRRSPNLLLKLSRVWSNAFGCQLARRSPEVSSWTNCLHQVWFLTELFFC